MEIDTSADKAWHEGIAKLLLAWLVADKGIRGDKARLPERMHGDAENITANNWK